MEKIITIARSENSKESIASMLDRYLIKFDPLSSSEHSKLQLNSNSDILKTIGFNSNDWNKRFNNQQSLLNLLMGKPANIMGDMDIYPMFGGLKKPCRQTCGSECSRFSGRWYVCGSNEII